MLLTDLSVAKLTDKVKAVMYHKKIYQWGATKEKFAQRCGEVLKTLCMNKGLVHLLIPALQSLACVNELRRRMIIRSLLSKPW